MKVGQGHTTQQHADATATTEVDNNNASQTAVASHATAAVIDANPNPYPPKTGTLALIDSLQKNNSQNSWSEVNTSNYQCSFKDGTYRIIGKKYGFFYSCGTSQSYTTNFCLEVSMTIVNGTQGAIEFRGGKNGNYNFSLDANGYVKLGDNDPTNYNSLTASQTDPIIKKGLGQTNLIAVIANKDEITIYVNGKAIINLHDKKFTEGYFYLTAGDISDVSFKNLRLWTF